MRRNHARPSRTEKIRNHRFREGLPLVGIGASAQLVDEHETVFIGVIDDFHDIGHVRGKGGKALLDALGIPDIAVNFPKDGNLRPFCGDKKPAHRHEAKQPHHFQRNRFTARIGAADEQKTVIPAERQRNGHYFFAVDQRVAATIERDDPRSVDGGLDAGQLIGIFGAGVKPVELLQHFYV